MIRIIHHWYDRLISSNRYQNVNKPLSVKSISKYPTMLGEHFSKLKPAITHDPRYFKKTVTDSNGNHIEVVLLIYATPTVKKLPGDGYQSLYSIIIQPITYSKYTDRCLIETDSLQYSKPIILTAYCLLGGSDKPRINIGGGLRAVRDFSIPDARLRGLGIASLALNHLILWCQENHPDAVMNGLTLTEYHSEMDNGVNGKRRDRLYSNVGYTIEEDAPGHKYGVGHAVVHHQCRTHSFGFQVFLYQEWMNKNDRQTKEILRKANVYINEIVCDYQNKITRLLFCLGSVITFLLILVIILLF